MTKRVFIGIPTYRLVRPEALGHIISLITYSIGKDLLGGIKILANGYIAQSRNTIVKETLEAYKLGECTHLLFLDDDMIIPANGLEMLLSHNLPVVGGLYYNYINDKIKPLAYDLDPFRLLESAPSRGLIEVDGIGLGFTLIDCSVLMRMKDAYQDEYWFQTSVIEENKIKSEAGEDVFFFKRLKTLGIPAYVDCGISLQHLASCAMERGGYHIVV